VPAGALDQRSRQWRQNPKSDKVLFWPTNLSRVFRAKWFEAMRVAGLRCQEPLPDAWVVVRQEGRPWRAGAALPGPLSLSRRAAREEHRRHQDGKVSFFYRARGA